MSLKIALLGAGGKMGQRITDNMVRHPDKYEMAYAEVIPLRDDLTYYVTHS